TTAASRHYTAGNVSNEPQTALPLPTRTPLRASGATRINHVRVTIKDVASRANVGIATVSRVLNDDVNVADETRLRVSAACRELGYTRNNLARSLKTGSTDNIGVAIMSRHAPVILNPFYAEVIGGIEQALQHAGKHLLLSSLRRRDDLIDLAREGRVDGLIVVGCDIADAELARLAEGGRPV